MKKFMFTSDQIDYHKSSRKEWSHFVRSQEAEMIFSVFPGTKFQLGLELGAGNGGQSITISKYCDNLICTEKDEKSHAWLGQTILERQMSNVKYELCDAQDLSRFSDSTFDLVFSSNMLEHIPDVDKCLKECQRVLKDDGVMLHTMPGRWWKLFHSALNLVQLKRPGIHGVSTSQYKEFCAFGAKNWVKRIETLGLNITEVIGLPFYVGHGNSFIPIIKAGNALNLSSSYLYIIRKK